MQAGECVYICESVYMFVCDLVCAYECETERGIADAEALCLYKAAVPSTTIILSHAQKVLPQTVTVPCPYLRFPWRFLHPQVGNPDAPFHFPRNVSFFCTSHSHHVFVWCVPSRFFSSFNSL